LKNRRKLEAKWIAGGGRMRSSTALLDATGRDTRVGSRITGKEEASFGKRVMLFAVAFAVYFVVLAGGASSQAAVINGLSDQNMDRWGAAANNLFTELDSQYVRYITNYDIAIHKRPRPCAADDDSCRRYWQLVDWVAKAKRERRQVLISFELAAGCETIASCDGPPSVEGYRTAITAFLTDPNLSGIREFSAWNEPNHHAEPDRFYIPPETAAQFWNTLNQTCQILVSGGCTVAAGDFADDPNIAAASQSSYTTPYKAELSRLGANPSVWAVHAHSSVSAQDLSQGLSSNTVYTRLKAWINQQSNNGKPVWISEVGALTCKGNTNYGAGEQNARAAFLKNKLLPDMPPAVQRAYYYFLAKPFSGEEACPAAATFDSALVGAGDVKRPAFRTLVPCGSWRTGGFHWDMSNGFSGVNITLDPYGNPSDIPVVGDWNADGIDTPGVVRPDLLDAQGQRTSLTWYLSNSWTTRRVDHILEFGQPGDIPVVGDWNGDHRDTPGVFRDSQWLLSNTFTVAFPNIAPSRTPGTVAHDFNFGLPGDRTVIGDWNGNGTDSPGVVRGATWYISDTLNGSLRTYFVYGNPGDYPVAGDWNRDGFDTPGVYRGVRWNLTDNLPGVTGPPTVHVDVEYGLPCDVPVPGDWNGDNFDTLGINR
jgi:Glycosyl hydrolase catalytic core